MIIQEYTDSETSNQNFCTAIEILILWFSCTPHAQHIYLCKKHEGSISRITIWRLPICLCINFKINKRSNRAVYERCAFSLICTWLLDEVKSPTELINCQRIWSPHAWSSSHRCYQQLQVTWERTRYLQDNHPQKLDVKSHLLVVIDEVTVW